jgi:hypothetical protein
MLVAQLNVASNELDPALVGLLVDEHIKRVGTYYMLPEFMASTPSLRVPARAPPSRDMTTRAADLHPETPAQTPRVNGHDHDPPADDRLDPPRPERRKPGPKPRPQLPHIPEIAQVEGTTTLTLARVPELRAEVLGNGDARLMIGEPHSAGYVDVEIPADRMDQVVRWWMNRHVIEARPL